MRILRFDELDSTNAYAKRNCSLLADKTLIWAHTQTAGRGRLQRTWLSQTGGLYFSVLLKPTKIDFLPNLTQWMALCVCQTLQKKGVHACLKWPNDVLADGKKISGILSEALVTARGVEGLVLGVGLNVQQTDLSQAGQPAVSLAQLGVQADLEELLQDIWTAFEAGYPAALQKGFEVFRADYLAHFPYIGQPVSIKQPTACVDGIVETISSRGELVLQTPQGKTSISIGDMCV